MSANVYSAITEYFERMHKEIIWPTLAGKGQGKKNTNAPGIAGPTLPAPLPRPDSLVLLRYVLMGVYSKAAILFQPPHRPCTSNDECEQGEECRGGVCVPVAEIALGSPRPCTSNDECEQGEECIGGVCTPVPGDLVFAPTSNVPDYSRTNELRSALAVYYDKIARKLIAGLATQPSRIAAVRSLLVQGYADCCKAAGVNWGPCGPAGCPDGFVCVDGMCVPVPFRLVFPQSTDPVNLP